MIGNSSRFDVVAELTRVVRARGRAADPVVRQGLARVVTRERILALLRERVRRDLLHAARPSIDGSVLKLLWSQAWAARAELGASLFGPYAAAGPLDEDTEDEDTEDARYWRTQMLARFGGSIGGGTDEIHRNHVAERVLGLPPEPRVDRDVPWRDSRG
jgi:alkylation response protein AidB-like acyl-CoA dehydrogenase